MHVKEMEARYSHLRKAYDSGQLNEAAFSEEVARLRYQAKDGKWYQVDPSDGGWVAWDGKVWKKIRGKKAKVSEEQKKDIAKETPPTEFRPLLGYILRLTWKSFKKQLPIAIILSIVSFALYFYVFIMLNDGIYSMDNSLPWGIKAILKIGAIELGGIRGGISVGLICMVFSGLIFGILKYVFTKGPINGITALFRVPGEISGFFANAGTLATASLLSGMGLALVVGSIISGFSAIAMAVGMVAIVASSARSGLSVLIRAGWNSTFGTLKGYAGSKFSVQAGSVAIFAGSLGYLLRVFISPWPAFILGAALLLVTLIIVTSEKQKVTTAAASIVVGGLLAWFFTDTFAALADNGGWAEGGKTLPAWIKSDGAMDALWKTFLTGGATGAGLIGGPMLWNSLTNTGMSFDPSLFGEDFNLDETGGSSPGADDSSSDDGTKILSDDDAKDYLKQHNLMDDNNRFTKEFWDNWWNKLSGSDNLKGVGGGFSPNDKDASVDDIAIVLHDDKAPPDKDFPEPGKTSDPEDITGDPPEPETGVDSKDTDTGPKKPDADTGGKDKDTDKSAFVPPPDIPPPDTQPDTQPPPPPPPGYTRPPDVPEDKPGEDTDPGTDDPSDPPGDEPPDRDQHIRQPQGDDLPDTERPGEHTHTDPSAEVVDKPDESGLKDDSDDKFKDATTDATEPSDVPNFDDINRATDDINNNPDLKNKMDNYSEAQGRQERGIGPWVRAVLAKTEELERAKEAAQKAIDDATNATDDAMGDDEPTEKISDKDLKKLKDQAREHTGKPQPFPIKTVFQICNDCMDGNADYLHRIRQPVEPPPNIPEDEIIISKKDMYNLARRPVSKNAVLGESVFVEINRINTSMTNAEKVYLLVKGTNEVQTSKRVTMFYRIGMTFFQQLGPGATSVTVITEGGTKALTSAVVPDAAFVQNFMSNGPLKPLWGELSAARGDSALSIAPLPQTRVEVDAAIINAQKQNNQKEVKALKNILKLYNSLGGKNIKVVD